MDFKLHAPYSATGDQPEAIRKLTEGVRLGLDEQVLLGVTGSGKTFTMALGHREPEPPDARAGAQQDARCPALLGIPRVFPGKRRGILHFLLRLLPA